jgi:hypothetical protein
VQLRQWRKGHEDAHYVAWYEREYAIMIRESAMFVCIDDKHKIKVGEPSFCRTWSSSLSGVTVSISCWRSWFHQVSIIPSVVLLADIKIEISGSWYVRQVFVLFKDGAFEPSSPIRHATKLVNILENEAIDRPVLFLYSDGGPDHRVMYLSVKLSLIALFLKRDLDYLCAARTAP